MAHKIEWGLFPRILLIALSGDLSIKDLEHFSADVVTHLDDAETRVHLIIDDTKVGKPPINLHKIQEVLQYTRHPMLGWQVAIGIVNPIVNFVAPMVMKLVGVDLVRRKTKEEAIAFLLKQDKTLNREEIT